MGYQAFFFDFDGVLADSVEVKTRAFANLFAPYGPEIVNKVVEHHRRHGGMTRKEKFQHYFKKFLKMPLNDQKIQQFCDIFSSFVIDEVIASPEIPGAAEFLNKWSKKVPCFIISATPDEEIVTIVNRRGLGLYFKEIKGSSQSKENNLRTILLKYGLEPARCLFFGDSESDYCAASACKVDFMGILPGPEVPLLQIVSNLKWARNFTALIFEKNENAGGI
ncbi:MAG: HAD-IA family hydrolase [Thermodesulfobacteriota bacterium]